MNLDPPGLVIVGQHIGKTDGLSFINELRHQVIVGQAAVIFILDHPDNHLKDAILAAGVQNYLVKPYRRSELIRCLSAQLNNQVEQKWKSLPERQREALEGTIDVFHNISDNIANHEPIRYESVESSCAPLVDAVNNNDFSAILDGVKDHDNYSYVHSLRVATFLSLFGHAMGLEKPLQMILASGGLLHDVGKIKIPFIILNKSERLSPEEWDIMRSHVAESEAVLQASGKIPKGVITIAAQHHEKLDGTGYPRALKGNELNRLARMASITDVFSALTDRRAYKPEMPAEQAFHIMLNEMGGQLDHELLSKFRQVLLDACPDRKSVV